MASKDRPFDEPTPDRPARGETPADPAASPVVEYPKMLYHADGRRVTVQNADEEQKAKAEGFQDTPVSPEDARKKRA